jgi:MFS family permease
MDSFTFGLLTSLFIVGGFLGALVSSRAFSADNRRQPLIWASLFICLGSFQMAASGTFSALGWGRLVIGIGSGIGTVVVPLFGSEVIRKELRGKLGRLTLYIICRTTRNMNLIPFRRPNSDLCGRRNLFGSDNWLVLFRTI